MNGKRRAWDPRRLAWTAAIAAALPGVCGCGGRGAGRPVSGLGLETLRIKEKPFVVEVVWEPDAIRRGLMFRESLPEDHGMLFVFADEGYRSFWMKNTSIPLSIAYIDGEGRILQIEDMTPHSLARHRSRDEVPYALEMPQGWFRKNGIAEGDRIEDLAPIRPYRDKARR